MRKTSPAAQRKFSEIVLEYLKKVGTYHFDGTFDMYRLETPFGTLQVHVPEVEDTPCYGLACYARFLHNPPSAELVERSRKPDITNSLNTYSGKFNFHRSAENLKQAEAAAIDCKHQLYLMLEG